MGILNYGSDKVLCSVFWKTLKMIVNNIDINNEQWIEFEGIVANALKKLGLSSTYYIFYGLL